MDMRSLRIYRYRTSSLDPGTPSQPSAGLSVDLRVQRVCRSMSSAVHKIKVGAQLVMLHSGCLGGLVNQTGTYQSTRRSASAWLNNPFVLAHSQVAPKIPLLPPPPFSRVMACSKSGLV